jgi:hypothetical protein
MFEDLVADLTRNYECRQVVNTQTKYWLIEHLFL